MKRSCTILLVLMYTPAVAKQSSVLVVPFPLQARGLRLDSAARDRLDGHLATSMKATGKFEPVDSNRLQTALAAAGKCDKQDCRQRVARELGASAFLTTEVTKPAKVCVIAATLHDAAKGTATRTGTSRGRCDEPAMRTAIDEVVAKVAGTWTKNDLCPMVFVPAGEFLQGGEVFREGYSSGGECCYTADKSIPARRVHLDAFYIDKHEVTVAQYRRCVRAGACTAPAPAPAGSPASHLLNWFAAGRENHPINHVTWKQAHAYCRWAGKRLPSETEWEKAARGTDGRIYPWGNEPPSCRRAVMLIDELHKLRDNESWTDRGGGCDKRRTWPVGSKPAGDSPYGVNDVSGNVREFVNDWYSDSYRFHVPRRNPKGPRWGSYHVIRGGGLFDGRSYCQRCDALSTTFRTADFTYKVGTDLGFRCAMTP